jgi:hypothetical protein
MDRQTSPMTAERWMQLKEIFEAVQGKRPRPICIARSWAPGTRLGPYQILGLLGERGMAKVYRGLDTRLNRAVAIKVSAQQFGKRFELEA